ncbi:hypothetical protein [Streptomyces californicus]|uniref:hypothetical protein n=1 Tax=Streptomyces californicus TaxID=67351 RepID=UPI00381E3BC3
MPDTSPTPADQLRAAAERARETGGPLHLVAAGLLEVSAQSAPAVSVDETARAALAVARQLLGTTTAAAEPSVDRRARYAAAIRETDGWVLDDGQHMIDAVMAVADAEQASLRAEAEGLDEALRGAISASEKDGARLRAELAAAAPPAPTDRAATRDRIRRAICEASGFDWDPDTLEPDEYGEHADAVLAVLDPPADRAAVLREAADFVGNDDTCDCGGCDTCIPNRLADRLRRLADEAEYIATPCSWGACEPGGEPCTTHERLMAHAEGDHELCDHKAGEAAAGAHQTEQAQPTETEWVVETEWRSNGDWRRHWPARATRAEAEQDYARSVAQDAVYRYRIVRVETTTSVEPTPAAPAAPEETR